MSAARASAPFCAACYGQRRGAGYQVGALPARPMRRRVRAMFRAGSRRRAAAVRGQGISSQGQGHGQRRPAWEMCRRRGAAGEPCRRHGGQRPSCHGTPRPAATVHLARASDGGASSIPSRAVDTPPYGGVDSRPCAGKGTVNRYNYKSGGCEPGNCLVFIAF